MTPLITRYSQVSLNFSLHLNVQHQHHKSTSPLGVLGQKDGPNVSQKDPADHKIPSGFFDFSSRQNVQHQHHQSTSPLGVLGQKGGPMCLQKGPQIRRFPWVLCFCKSIALYKTNSHINTPSAVLGHQESPKMAPIHLQRNP